MTGTKTLKNGITTHRCSSCGHRFEGSGKKGRPFKHCLTCRANRAARAQSRR